MVIWVLLKFVILFNFWLHRVFIAARLSLAGEAVGATLREVHRLFAAVVSLFVKRRSSVVVACGQTRYWTHVSCIGKQTLIHCATKGNPLFENLLKPVVLGTGRQPGKMGNSLCSHHIRRLRKWITFPTGMVPKSWAQGRAHLRRSAWSGSPPQFIFRNTSSGSGSRWAVGTK